MAIFHPGELAIQHRAGFGNAVVPIGQRFIRDTMPEQHQRFFAQLPFVLLGALDVRGHPRAGLLAGAPGFLRVPDERHLDVHDYVVAGEGISEALVPGAQVGMLGIEAHTRRRNRLNGTIVGAEGGTLSLAVAQSFGNCPKYIQPRHAEWQPAAASGAHVTRGWDAAAGRMVAGADTFFIVTAHPDAARPAEASHGVDISHRGGETGFVRIDGQTLSVADYPGNRFFNTIGNLELNPLAGLMFIDHVSGELLQLAVRAHVEWLPPPDTAPTRPGRTLHFEVLEAERTTGGLPLRWSAAT